MIRRNLPNQLTLLRLLLAALFFLALNQYRYDQANPTHPWVLITAIALFSLAAITDALDGYLARKWKAESTFGRIMDPFCDKVLIMGALIYLAGPRFVDPLALNDGVSPIFHVIKGNMISGIYPWMVVLILARELLVTGIRGEMEGHGVKFPSTLSGKLKMIFQCIGLPVIMLIVLIDPKRQGWEWLTLVRDVIVYTMVISTVLSGWPYVTRAVRQSRDSRE